MTNVYTWKITRLEKVPSAGGKTDIIKNVYWQLVGEDGDPKHEVSFSGGVELDPPGDVFTPYAQVTEQTVIGWVQAKLDVAAWQKKIDDWIAGLVSPSIVEGTLPWVPPPPAEPAGTDGPKA